MSFRFIVAVLLQLSSGYAQPSGAFTATGRMITPRWRHTATLLDNGRVLIAGGQAADATLAIFLPLASAELYDPATGTFVPAGTMNEARAGHIATLLPDGRVLIAGGWNEAGQQAAGTAEIYDPSTNAFTRTGLMLPNFYPQTATLLKSGQVLITGSLKGSFCGTTAMDTVAQLYDPGAGTFAPAGRAANYCFATAALLPDGRVLIVPGGPEGDASFAEIYDPKADFFSVNDWVDSLSRGSYGDFSVDREGVGYPQWPGM
jgi:hypothetical protein